MSSLSDHLGEPKGSPFFCAPLCGRDANVRDRKPVMFFDIPEKTWKELLKIV